MRAGRLRKPVTIEQLSGGAWATLATVYAAVVALDTTEAKALPLSPTHRVEIRYRTDVTAKMRVLNGSQYLYIEAVLDPDGRSRELHLMCALADVSEAGSAVTFTFANPGNYDEATDTYSGASSSTVAGFAIRIDGDPKRYEELELQQVDAVTLLFTPTTYGELPALGSHVTWNDIVYMVRDVEPVAPDGPAVRARVVVTR